MLKKKWCKPQVQELDVLKTEFLLDDLFSTAATEVFFLFRGDHRAKGILPIS